MTIIITTKKRLIVHFIMFITVQYLVVIQTSNAQGDLIKLE